MSFLCRKRSSKSPAKSKKRTKEGKLEGQYFGVPLSSLVERSDAPGGVPTFIRQCVEYVSSVGRNIEGVYRTCGSQEELNRYQELIDARVFPDLEAVQDPKIITGLVSLFLRKLPEPLIPFEVVDSLLQVWSTKQREREKKREDVKEILKRGVPTFHRNFLLFLFQHLNGLTHYQETTQMSSTNFAIVFAPSILYRKEESLESIGRDGPSISSLLTEWIENPHVYFGEVQIGTKETEKDSSGRSAPMPIDVVTTSLPNEMTSKSLSEGKGSPIFDEARRRRTLRRAMSSPPALSPSSHGSSRCGNDAMTLDMISSVIRQWIGHGLAQKEDAQAHFQPNVSSSFSFIWTDEEADFLSAEKREQDARIQTLSSSVRRRSKYPYLSESIDFSESFLSGLRWDDLQTTNGGGRSPKRPRDERQQGSSVPRRIDFGEQSPSSKSSASKEESSPVFTDHYVKKQKLASGEEIATSSAPSSHVGGTTRSKQSRAISKDTDATVGSSLFMPPGSNGDSEEQIQSVEDKFSDSEDSSSFVLRKRSETSDTSRMAVETAQHDVEPSSSASGMLVEPHGTSTSKGRSTRDDHAHDQTKISEPQRLSGGDISGKKPLVRSIIETPLEFCMYHLQMIEAREKWPADPDAMTMRQIQSKKSTIKKLLRQYDKEFERLHGREPRKAEKEPLRKLYQIYKTLRSRIELTSSGKQIGSVSAASGKEGLSMPAALLADTLRSQGKVGQREKVMKWLVPEEEEEEKEEKEQVASGKDERKVIIGDAHLSEREGERMDVEGYTLKDHDRVKAEKRQLQKKLHEYQNEFFKLHGRKVQYRADRLPMEKDYERYKFLREVLKKLEELQQKGIKRTDK
eukprot:TRINITY_DN1468_c1_g2_i3.p1 TRINITY_DN1468_c1_g2~~TRINITY_DN1468_c1_g2_i3.p1  ORF type:complete len:855 (-),score=237.84 TRINITY_DN1468_c1_g2_i3:167-2731(-)